MKFSAAFNFRTGAHDVTQVTKEAYDACNGTNPISHKTTGPANITLNATGEHYYICAVPGHCSAGQKLSINVTGASSPAPQPSSPSPRPAAPTPVTTPAPAPEPSSATTPSPTSSPSPAPSRAPVTYTVGDSDGWTILPGGASAYATWASNKTFIVGDVLGKCHRPFFEPVFLFIFCHTLFLTVFLICSLQLRQWNP